MSSTRIGRFIKLVPDELVVEVDEFEADDPALRGEMTITISLADAGGGTDLVAVHDGLPSGVSPADNMTGWENRSPGWPHLSKVTNQSSPGMHPAHADWQPESG